MEKGYKGFIQVTKFLFGYFKNLDSAVLKIKAYFTLFLIFVTILINTSSPIIFKMLVQSFEHAIDPSFGKMILILLFIYGSIWTLGQMIAQLREVIFIKVACRILRFVSIDVLHHLLCLSMRFHAFKQTGSVVGAIKQAQDAIPGMMYGFLFVVLPVFVEIIFASSLMTYNYGITYGGIIASLFVVYTGFTLYSSQKILEAQQAFNLARQQEFGKTTDTLLNIETVKYFGQEKFEMEKCNEVLIEREQAEANFYFMVEVVHLLQGTIIGCGLMITIILSGLRVLSGSFLISDFVMINSYVLQFVSPFMALSKYIREIRKGVANMQNALQMLEIKPEITQDENPVDISNDANLKVEFVDVNFGYFGDMHILKGFSLNVPANKMTAIVGATGAGKSTITKLLFRFYDVLGGELLINGINIKKYSLASINKCFSVVPQAVAMFNNTLRYNLLYAKPDASEEELWEALTIAKLDTFVKNLPQGFETKVGEYGVRLSGGERQRLAIARAILRKPKLFLFDEATSALDTNTERFIQQSLSLIAGNITTLVIAHRLSTVVNADQIVVIEQGSVAEIGTHNELLKKNGSYSKLWHEQFMKTHEPNTQEP